MTGRCVAFTTSLKDTPAFQADGGAQARGAVRSAELVDVLHRHGEPRVLQPASTRSSTRSSLPLERCRRARDGAVHVLSRALIWVIGIHRGDRSSPSRFWRQPAEQRVLRRTPTSKRSRRRWPALKAAALAGIGAGPTAEPDEPPPRAHDRRVAVLYTITTTARPSCTTSPVSIAGARTVHAVGTPLRATARPPARLAAREDRVRHRRSTVHHAEGPLHPR